MAHHKFSDKLVQQLKALQIDGLGPHPKYDTVKVNPTVIERDGRLLVSGEDGQPWADYYGEYRGGYPWINPVLEQWAKRHGCYWEWENPGAIMLVKE